MSSRATGGAVSCKTSPVLHVNRAFLRSSATHPEHPLQTPPTPFFFPYFKKGNKAAPPPSAHTPSPLFPLPPMMTDLPSRACQVPLGTMPVSVLPEGGRFTPWANHSGTQPSSMFSTDSVMATSTTWPRGKSDEGEPPAVPAPAPPPAARRCRSRWSSARTAPSAACRPARLSPSDTLGRTDGRSVGSGGGCLEWRFRDRPTAVSVGKQVLGSRGCPPGTCGTRQAPRTRRRACLARHPARTPKPARRPLPTRETVERAEAAHALAHGSVAGLLGPRPRLPEPRDSNVDQVRGEILRRGTGWHARESRPPGVQRAAPPGSAGRAALHPAQASCEQGRSPPSRRCHRTSGPRPHCSMTPGRKFSSRTSQFWASFLISSWPCSL